MLRVLEEDQVDCFNGRENRLRVCVLLRKCRPLAAQYEFFDECHETCGIVEQVSQLELVAGLAKLGQDLV